MATMYAGCSATEDWKEERNCSLPEQAMAQDCRQLFLFLTHAFNKTKKPKPIKQTNVSPQKIKQQNCHHHQNHNQPKKKTPNQKKNCRTTMKEAANWQLYISVVYLDVGWHPTHLSKEFYHSTIFIYRYCIHRCRKSVMPVEITHFLHSTWNIMIWYVGRIHC